MIYKYEQGDMVDFDYGPISGYGMVCGVSVVDLPVIGCHCIVEIYHAPGIDRISYPFQCISVAECHLKLRN